MLELFSAKDVLAVASQYDVDQSDALESFLCELLNINADELYEQIDKVISEN